VQPSAKCAVAEVRHRALRRVGARNNRDLRAALTIIRRAVEDCAPPGSAPNDELPDPWYEAEALVRGIYAIAERRDDMAEIRGANNQAFDELRPDKRPQDDYGDGRDWAFRTAEHGGDEPDSMPQVIEATDAQGRRAIYVPLRIGDKIVVPRPGRT